MRCGCSFCSPKKMNKDSEKYIEKSLRIEVRKLKGECWKWVSPGNRGVPDRIVTVFPGIADFVELKTRGRDLDPLQAWQHKRLRNMGFQVHKIDTWDKLQDYLLGLKIRIDALRS